MQDLNSQSQNDCFNLGLNSVHPAFIMGWMDCTDELTTPGHFAEKEKGGDSTSKPTPLLDSFLPRVHHIARAQTK